MLELRKISRLEISINVLNVKLADHIIYVDLGMIDTYAILYVYMSNVNDYIIIFTLIY